MIKLVYESFSCFVYVMLLLCFHAGFLLSLFFRPWRWRRYVPPKHRLTLNGLHGVISQKTVLFNGKVNLSLNVDQSLHYFGHIPPCRWPWEYVILGQNHFLPSLVQFIIHLLGYNSVGPIAILKPVIEPGYFVANWWRTPLRHPPKVTIDQ
jgi:hypothetical protein